MAGPTLNLLDLPNEVLDYILSLLHPSSSLFECGQTCGRLALAVERVLAHMAVELPKSVKDQSLIWRSERTLETRSTHIPQGCEISKRYSHSACYDDNSYSMYVFGGCTSTSTTFNDLWKLDLKTRTWQRPLSTGTYPSPKACSTMVLSQGQLYLFGGWTHPSLYPLHQSWRLFNELHCYDIEQNRWSHLTPVGVAKPPSMAGHSATVHEDIIVVFGGLQKQRNHIGQFCSSNDVWCFNITSKFWDQKHGFMALGIRLEDKFFWDSL
ncbi:hypothetical protein TCAL_13457 [Tigriopus californicus]|uniref:F-box domain-containing protein n=1 Tax=Tigriopus californicus TaxID=6832 RepID=A0A553PG01_TIGCA|nr:hypothetical protein TCAL_13457 [Tigriopus californicus]